MPLEENPTCSECSAEIVVALHVVDGFAPWLCLECSGATLSDFVDDEPESASHDPNQCAECGDNLDLNGNCALCDF